MVILMVFVMMTMLVMVFTVVMTMLIDIHCDDGHYDLLQYR
jgi:hypothetical protein